MSSQLPTALLLVVVYSIFHLLVEISLNLLDNNCWIERRKYLEKMPWKSHVPSKKNMDTFARTLSVNSKSLTRRNKLKMEPGTYQTSLRNTFINHLLVETKQKLMLGMRDSWVQKCSSILNFSIKTSEHLLMKLLTNQFSPAQWIIEENYTRTLLCQEVVPYSMVLIRS